jgi:hypothetical protein
LKQIEKHALIFSTSRFFSDSADLSPLPMILFIKNYLKVVTVAAERRLGVGIVSGESGMRQFSQDLEVKSFME